MSLFIASLNSGSNGNCYYVGNAHEAVLIDAGLSCRETERRMRRMGLHLNKVRAIFITHEHIDHVKGMETLALKHSLPVYITEQTHAKSGVRLPPHVVHPFRAYEPVTIGELTVHPFPKLHDAVDAHSFNVTGEGVTIGVFTDIGAPCEHFLSHFRQCHAAFLEANYDEHMLETGRYPLYLKRRIRGGHGHLSNRQAAELFLHNRPPFMTHLILSHLSKNNNTPQLAYESFSPIAQELNVIVASRDVESAVYRIDRTDMTIAGQQYMVQATLF